MDEFISSLSQIQLAFLSLLERSEGLTVDEFIGTFLLLKDDVEQMEDWILWMWDEHPTGEQLQIALVEYCKQKNGLE